MSLDERVSDLIKRIYRASHDSSAWDDVTRDVLATVGGHAGLSTLVDLKCREYNSTRFYGCEDTQIAIAIEEYGELYKSDPTLAWAASNPRARFCDSSKAVGNGAYLSDAFVRWNHARLGATHWYVGYTLPNEPLSYSLSVHFPAEQGPGSSRAIRLFRMLFDHLDCSMRLARRPFNADTSRPLVMLETDGTVRTLSDGAQKLLSGACPALNVVTGRLEAACASEQAALDAALARAASVLSSGASIAAVRLRRPSGQRPWLLTIKPVLYTYGAFGKVLCELLAEIHDGTSSLGSLDLLQSLFDLSGRELELVELLADGHCVDSLARCMNISTNTARTHLRSIFAKTETSRQAELLQLCAGLAKPQG